MCVACVFTRNQINVAQDLQRAVSDIRKVSDRCRNEIKSAWHCTTKKHKPYEKGKGPGVAEAFEWKSEQGR